jgi:hypothetical protein
MVVNNFGTIRLPFLKAKTNTPRPIYRHSPLSFAVTFQLMQSHTFEGTEILERGCRISSIRSFATEQISEKNLFPVYNLPKEQSLSTLLAPMDDRKSNPDIIKELTGMDSSTRFRCFDDVFAKKMGSALRLYRHDFSSVIGY